MLSHSTGSAGGWYGQPGSRELIGVTYNGNRIGVNPRAGLYVAACGSERVTDATAAGQAANADRYRNWCLTSLWFDKVRHIHATVLYALEAPHTPALTWLPEHQKNEHQAGDAHASTSVDGD